ncbi:MAG: hypothetical protein ABH815_01325 [Candidatus Omnitrophota bacterium]
MKDKEGILMEFHGINNWLNKITLLAGQSRYELEVRGFDAQNLEEEKKRFIKLLNDIEDRAMKVGAILKDLKLRIKEA